MPETSTLRVLVDKALKAQNTDLQAFVEHRQGNGKSVREITRELGVETGIPISYRTLYRWLDDLERQAS